MGLLDFFRTTKNAHQDQEEPLAKSKDVLQRSIKQQLYRFNQEIRNWQAGINCAEEVYSPTTVELIRVYNDMVIDAHLSALLQIRKSKTLGKDYKIVNEAGEEMPGNSELLTSAWFRDSLELALDSKFYGYSLLQFGDRRGQSFECVKSVPREYVYPQKNAVRATPYSAEELTRYDRGKYKNWTIFIGKPGDLGLLMKASPLVIFKKTATASWAEFAELFGSPLRIGKTNVTDEALANNMYDMLENMGRNAFAVIDGEDNIEFVRDGKQDAYNVFNELIERSNSELSKLILGSTMTTDDGSSRSQAEVHEATSNAIAKEDAVFIENFVNHSLIPFLNNAHGFNIEGRFMFDDTEQTTKAEQFKIDLELLKSGKFKIPAEYFKETYNTPVEEVEEPEETNPAPEDAENVLKKKFL